MANPGEDGYAGQEAWPHMIVYPQPELRFDPSGAEEETSVVALVNCCDSDISFKFKTNAERLGLRMLVRPPSGIIEPDSCQDVFFTVVRGGSLELSAELKVVVETQSVDVHGRPDGTPPRRLRLPCLRAPSPLAAPGPSVRFAKAAETAPPAPSWISSPELQTCWSIPEEQIGRAHV